MAVELRGARWQDEQVQPPLLAGLFEGGLELGAAVLLEDSRVTPFTHQRRPLGDWLHLRLSGPQDVSLALPAVEESYRHVQATAAPGRRRRR